jgi:hypothetical protein
LRRLVSLFYTDVVLEIDLQDDYLNATAQLEKLIAANAACLCAPEALKGAFKPGKSGAG